MVVEHNPVADYAAGMLLGFEAAAVGALLAYTDCFVGWWKSSTDVRRDTSPGMAIRLIAVCQTRLREKLLRQV